MATEQDKAKREVLADLSFRLEKFGFAKKGNTLIRETETGLYQIIGVGLGQAWSTMRNHIGLGFGVATEEWIDKLNNWKRPKVLTESDCEIRDCNCKLIPVGDETIWYKITNDLSPTTDKIFYRIEHYILPFLEQLKSREEIIKSWRLHNEKIGLPPRHLLSIGILMYLNGHHEEGEKILREELEQNKNNSFYQSAISKTLNFT
jgi:hypothetical protein